MITVTDLHYTYPQGDSPAVKQVNFSVYDGEIYGFLGPSGAGKSTTQKVLIGLLPGYQGNISVMDKALSDWGKSYYNHVGVGFELPNHYTKLTARENLNFFASFYQKECEKPEVLLEKVGLTDAIDKKVSDFSKGMKMRLNFVRAIMHDPDLLFFDEPTSGLDPGNARLIKDLILDLKSRGKTIFLTTHSMHDADELCDRVSLMVEGELVVTDSPQALKLAHSRRKVKVVYQNGAKHEAEFDMEGLGQNEEFLRIIRDTQLQTLHSEEASLEQVFIKLTGKSLRETL